MGLVKKLCLVVGFLLSVGVHSAPITFEHVPLGLSEGFTTDGFDFSFQGFGTGVYFGQTCDPACPNNGTTMVLVPYGPVSNNGNITPSGMLSMKKSDGSLFDFFGFDGGGVFNFNKFAGGAELIPDSLDVVGVKFGGVQVVQSFLIDKTTNSNGTLNLTSFDASSDFSDLLALYISSSGAERAWGNGFTVDNIRPDMARVSEFDYVRPEIIGLPEPKNVVLLVLGLLGIMLNRKRGSGRKVVSDAG